MERSKTKNKVVIKTTRTFLKGEYSDRAIIDLMNKYKVVDRSLTIDEFKRFGKTVQQILKTKDMDESEFTTLATYIHSASV